MQLPTNSLSPPTPVEQRMLNDVEYHKSVSCFEMMVESVEDNLFAQHGYKRLHKLVDYEHTQLIKAEIIKSKENSDVIGSKIVIKRVCKTMTDREGTTISATYNIVKEALIIKHLTKDNVMIGDYVSKYVDFFQSESHFYLVTEYIVGIPLKEFIETGHSYLKCGKLKITEWRKVIKFIMWQLTVTLRFLHEIYRCCHLDLCAEHIMLQNVAFIKDPTTHSVSISNHISIKVCNFDSAEIFDAMNVNFQCNKHELFKHKNAAYQSPKELDGGVYDGRAADMWSLGMIYYQCMAGKPLYTADDIIFGQVDDLNNPYIALQRGGLEKWMLTNNAISPLLRKQEFIILCSLLSTNEERRMSANQCMKAKYFKSYMKIYQDRITEKIKNDVKKVNEQQRRMKTFPYYSA